MSLAAEELPPSHELIFCYKDLDDLLDAKLIMSFALRICKQQGQAFLAHVFTAWTTAMRSLPRSEVNAMPDRLSWGDETSFLTRCLNLLDAIDDDAEDYARPRGTAGLEAATDFHDGDLPGCSFIRFLHQTCAGATIDLVREKMDVATVERSFSKFPTETVKRKLWTLVKGRKSTGVCGGLWCGLGAELLMALIQKGLPRWCWAGCIGPFSDNLLQHIIEPANRAAAMDGKEDAEGRLCILLARRFSLEELCHQNQDGRNALSYAEEFADHCADGGGPMVEDRNADVWIEVRDVIREEMEARTRAFQGDLLKLVELARRARAGLGGEADSLDSLPAFDEEIWRRSAALRDEWWRMGWRFRADTRGSQITEVLNWHLQAVGRGIR
ncbi:FCPE [Symbiodinium sp. CCMP2456]|nr:FCPE [Symbiodinium sp. CCMP2456]